MSERLFGYLVALFFVAVGAFTAARPDRLLRIAREHNEGKFWTRNRVYEITMRPSVYIPMMRVVGWTALLVGVALIIGLLLSRNQT
jgi:hypothetical protein